MRGGSSPSITWNTAAKRYKTRKKGVMTPNPWDIPIAKLKTRWPGTTRNRRTPAAVALLDIIVEKEQQVMEKVERGLSRLQVVMSSGSLPSLAVL